MGEIIYYVNYKMIMNDIKFKITKNIDQIVPVIIKDIKVQY